MSSTTKKAAVLVLLFSVAYATAGAGQARPNGIFVAGPKLYDSRALFLLLDELEEQLARLQVVDQEKLISSLGLVQGIRSREQALGASLAGLPIPSSSTTLEPSEEGNLKVTSHTKTTSKVTPLAPGAPATSPNPTNPLTLGLHAQDLLADQVNLTYQIFSLRLVLERALSDRLLLDQWDHQPRQQAILGFQVSLDPAHAERDRAAYVEVTVESTGHRGNCHDNPVSVVSLMPSRRAFGVSVSVGTSCPVQVAHQYGGLLANVNQSHEEIRARKRRRRSRGKDRRQRCRRDKATPRVSPPEP